MFHSVPASELHLQTKKTDTRLLSLLKESLTEADFILAGYADDEGIQNNSGRPGARLGPNKIREHLYKMTPPVFNPEKADIKLYDLGNIDLKMDLASRHEIAVSELQKKLQPHQKL